MENLCTVRRNANEEFTDFEKLTPDNIEEELKRMKLFDDDYQSDDDQRVYTLFNH